MGDDDQAEPIRVLIVEDDLRVQIGLSRFLSASPGFDVVGMTGTAERALAMAHEVAPAVALVDVLLPSVHDGLSLLRALTTELGIPAVAISIQSGLRLSVLEAGASQFIDKDSAPELMLAALRAAVSGRTA